MQEKKNSLFRNEMYSVTAYIFLYHSFNFIYLYYCSVYTIPFISPGFLLGNIIQS